ncbi:MAG: endonuclease III [Methylocystaceae bacterium]
MKSNSQKGIAEPASEIIERLQKEHIEAGPRLVFSGPYQALVAIILSAQTNDHQVNRVTSRFYVRFPDPAALAEANPEEVETYIKSVGLYHAKAANLVAAARKITEEFAGTVPDKFEDLLRLPGVGRKTANVMLATAFGKPGLGVDTHVLRVSNRLGLAHSKNPDAVENQLKAVFPPANWGRVHHLLIFHGRKVCTARKPQCSQCIVADLCPSSFKV